MHPSPISNGGLGIAESEITTDGRSFTAYGNEIAASKTRLYDPSFLICSLR
jgi:hypothetical protein